MTEHTALPIADSLAISSIIDQLQRIRALSLQQRGREGRPPRLPARRILGGVVERLSAALFPHRLGNPEVSDQGINSYVGHLLDLALRELSVEVGRELALSDGSGPVAIHARAEALVHEFAGHLPRIRTLLDSDVQAAFRGDPAAGSVDEVLVCYPGITAMIHHRLAHQLHRLGAKLCARLIAEIAHSQTGIDIHPGATIGEGFFIDHGTGVVIGETTIIGKGVRLYHGVTLGAKRFPVGEDGSIVKGGDRHPIIEDDVVIYAGATILGRVTIGQGSVIGGNVWLTHGVPAGSQVAQSQLNVRPAG
jgi:serine O-acetyltransferase